MTPCRFLIAVLACTAAAGASLLVAAEPVYDAWAWLVWGRELAQLRLDVSSGPSWKPLPVLLTAPLSLAGDAAAPLWLVVVRAAWLLSLLLAAQLAYALSAGAPRWARVVGAAFAAAALALLADEVTAWGRQAAGGMSEPLLVAFVLGAVLAALRDRPRAALGLGLAAALVRPEAWPLLALYALWCWRAAPRARPLAAAVALAVAVLWLLPELLGAGGGGAGRARRGTSDPLEALRHAFALPLLVVWPLALLALRARVARVLAAGVVLWIATVAAMTTIGFPGLPRFSAPAAAIAGVLAGAGLAGLLPQAAARLRSRAGATAWRTVPGAVTALLLALVVASAGVAAGGLGGRVGELAQAWRDNGRAQASHDRLRALVAAVGREPLLRCGNLATSDVLVRTLLAWELDVALARVVSFGVPSRASGAFVLGRGASRTLHDATRSAGTLLGARGEWRAYSIGCPLTASSSPARSAGVTGASR